MEKIKKNPLSQLSEKENNHVFLQEEQNMCSFIHNDTNLQVPNVKFLIFSKSIINKFTGAKCEVSHIL